MWGQPPSAVQRSAASAPHDSRVDPLRIVILSGAVTQRSEVTAQSKDPYLLIYFRRIEFGPQTALNPFSQSSPLPN